MLSKSALAKTSCVLPARELSFFWMSKSCGLQAAPEVDFSLCFRYIFRKGVTLPARETHSHNVDKSQKGAPEYEVKLKEVSPMLQNSCFSLEILVSHWLVSVSLAACHIFLGGLLALLCRLVFASWAACWRLLGGLSALPGRLVGVPGRLVGAAWAACRKIAGIMVFSSIGGQC